MRTLVALALLMPALGVPLACGGGTAETGGATAPGPASGSAPPSTADSSAPAPLDAGPTTTTTTTLGSGGDLQGAKLTQTTTVASTTGSSAPPRRRGRTRTKPGRGPADIRAIVVAHRDEARACYDAATAAHPGIQGDLVMQWTIDPKGNVTQVSSDTSRSQIVEPGVVACVAKVIQKIQFAPSPGGYETQGVLSVQLQAAGRYADPAMNAHAANPARGGPLLEPSAELPADLERIPSTDSCNRLAGLAERGPGAKRLEKLEGKRFEDLCAEETRGVAIDGEMRRNRLGAFDLRAALNRGAHVVEGVGDGEQAKRRVEIDSRRRPSVLRRRCKDVRIEGRASRARRRPP